MLISLSLFFVYYYVASYPYFYCRCSCMWNHQLLISRYNTRILSSFICSETLILAEKGLYFFKLFLYCWEDFCTFLNGWSKTITKKIDPPCLKHHIPLNLTDPQVSAPAFLFYSKTFIQVFIAIIAFKPNLCVRNFPDSK